MSRVRLGIAVGLALVAGMIGACVIAEPPTDLPSVPAIRPTIIRATAVPPTTGVITRWPDRFVIQVQLSDPNMTFVAASFVDYNPLTNEGFADIVSSSPSPGQNNAVRTLMIPILEPSRDTCHTVEIIVTRAVGRSPHTPNSADDGDTISWFYSPNGDLAGCPVVDAGLLPDATALDAGEDGGTS